MIKYAGMIAVLLSAAVISREYSSFSQKRLSEVRDFLSFVSHMKIQVGCFLCPASELVRGFSSERLSAVGFVGALSDGASLCDAYKNCEDRLSVGEEEREILGRLFSTIGECYLDDGLRLIDSSLRELESVYAKRRAEAPKNTRLVSVISVTSAIGFLMMVI